jgi:hypothetical protein
MAQASTENTTPLLVTRQAVEAQIDALIDLLDTIDADPDAEPSLGWQGPSGYLGESTNQGAADFWGSRNDCEDEHDGGEPDVEEGSLGWTETVNQDGVNWHGGYHGDLEDEHDGREPDDDKERWLGWANEGAQTFGAEGIYPDCEGTSPEWPAEHPTWQPPKHRVVAPPVPVIPMSACVRVPA